MSDFDLVELHERCRSEALHLAAEIEGLLAERDPERAELLRELADALAELRQVAAGIRDGLD
jgi:hypothetical protein